MSGRQENIVISDAEEQSTKPSIQVMFLFLPKIRDVIKM